MSRVTTEVKRVRRTPINGTRNVLTVRGKEPGFEYRIVNDEGDRVAQFAEQGYEIVSDSSVQVGDRRIANPTKEGSPVQISVGGGKQAYLMRIKQEFYKEDQQTKQEYVSATEEGIRREASKVSDFGSIKIG